jgi:hypothetical protein
MNVATVEYVVDLLKDDHQVSPQSDDKLIPGHFFNIEHSPYLFPMFSFKKHRSKHVCNHVTKVAKIST